MMNFFMFVMGIITGIFLMSLMIASSGVDDNNKFINKEKEHKNG